MCGIAGIVNMGDGPPVEAGDLRAMVASQRHRGPDQMGMYLEDDAAIGHARLSIIDLRGGAQPMANEDRSLWITYNGEVFNYPELRSDLEGKGHRFVTTSDTEVVLHAFEEEGPACLRRLNGQFAFAIWDARNKRLFLARDRVGIIPLHYMVHRGRFLFASEIKALFQVPGTVRRFDPVAMEQIFTFWTTLPGRTAFAGVSELPPGCHLTVTSGGIRQETYWDVPFSPRGEWRDRPLPEMAREVGDLVTDAVRIRLRADVPVGSYLSGGLDSSGITALIRGRFDNSLQTFGIRFEEGGFDEGEFQSLMVSHLGVEHRELRAGNADIARAFAETLWHCEKPLLRTAPVPLFLLSRLVRDSGFKVVVTGEGADEVFGGYNIYREAKIRAFWSRQPSSEARPLLIGKLYPYIFKDQRLAATLRGFFGQGIDHPEDPLFSHMVRWNNTSRIKTFFSTDLKEGIGGYDALEEVRGILPRGFSVWDTLSKAQYLEMRIFLSSYLLAAQGDRVAMGHSLEVRPPFLDHRIMEYMAGVPPIWKILGLREKHLLKKVFADILPPRVLQRPKHPYRAPIHETLLAGGDERTAERLSGSAIRQVGLFDGPRVERLLGKLRTAGQASEVDGMALAGILSTQILAESFGPAFAPAAAHGGPPDVLVDRRKQPASDAAQSGGADAK